MNQSASFGELHIAAINAHIRNDFRLAAELYRLCISMEPQNPVPRHHLGLLLAQIGHQDASQSLLNTALRLASEAQIRLFNHNLRALRGEPDTKVNTDLEFEDSNSNYRSYPEGTVDDWRHKRMLEFAKVFSGTNDQWLTVGDHYGHDAKRLKQHGIRNLTVSSLATGALEEAVKLGEVTNYLSLNAECMDLPDRSFDYVLCKESLHHMPRPYLAIYEMLRVARKGAFFIEPSDPIIDWLGPTAQSPLTREFYPDRIVGSSVRYRDRDGQEVFNKFTDWWEDGPFNYVYTMSSREIKKIALGHGLPSYGCLKFIDFYRSDWACQTAIEGSAGFEETKRQIRLYERLCDSTGIPYNYTVGMFFRETPSPDQMGGLQQLGANIQLTRTRFLAMKLM